MNNKELKELLNKIEPTKDEINRINNVVESVHNLLENNSGNLKIAEFHIGGSFKKGTMISGRNEADIVIAISPKNKKYLYRDLANINMNFIENTFYVNWYDKLIEYKDTHSKIYRDYKRNTLTMGTNKGVSLDFLVKFKKDQLITTSGEKEFENYYLERDSIQLEFVNKAQTEYPLYKNCVKLMKYFRNEEKLHELKSYMIEIIMYYSLVKYLKGEDYISYLNAFMKGIKDFNDKIVIEVSDKMYSYLRVTKAKLPLADYSCIDVSNRGNNVAEFINSNNIEKFNNFFNKYNDYFKEDTKQNKTSAPLTKLIVNIGLYYEPKTDKQFFQWGFDGDLNRRGGHFSINRTNNDEIEAYSVAINKIVAYAIKNSISNVLVKCDKDVYDYFVNGQFRGYRRNKRQEDQITTLINKCKKENINLSFQKKEDK